MVDMSFHFVCPAPGSTLFLLGTDRLGRDVLSRILYGARISLTIGLLGIAISFALGLVIGGLAGYYGGWVDMTVQRIIEIIRSFPELPLWMALSAVLPVTWSPILIYFGITGILALLDWTGLARAVRSKLLALREEDYTTAARLMGAQPEPHHRPPPAAGFMSHLIASATLSIPGMILGETALSLPRHRPAPADHELGRAAERGAEHQRRRALPVADAARRAGDHRHPRVQLLRRRTARRGGSVSVSRPDAFALDFRRIHNSIVGRERWTVVDSSCRERLPRAVPPPSRRRSRRHPRCRRFAGAAHRAFRKAWIRSTAAAKSIAKRVEQLTGGKFQIRVFAAGEIVPAFGVVDAIQQGTIECAHTASYYFVGKNKAFAFDTTLPFGLNQRQQNAWIYYGGGLELVREFFKDFGIISFPAGNTGVQMGGWWRKEVKTVNDLKGVKMRIAGLGGEVMARLGAVPQQIAGGDIYPALERGAIDSAEWVGPYDDEKLGFYKVAPHYYFPGLVGKQLDVLVLREHQGMGEAAEGIPGGDRGRVV